ncbi:MAG: hypothetical protein LBL84_02955 [Candidatus Nomurabacteria bacterium]|jgi:hypothetical protein|nr:hypothetical protein [Candidatus Nomurabacteria bacterium]
MTTNDFIITTSTEELIKRVNALDQLKQHDTKEREAETTFHVDGLGKSIMAGYESLRNAAEYTESHTLFQRAMMRFFQRNFSGANDRQIDSLATELVVELTLSGYIENDTVTEKKMGVIKRLIREHWELYRKKQRVKGVDLKAYVIAPLAARVEDVLFPYSKGFTVVQFAYEYFAKRYGHELDKELDKRRAHLTLLVATAKALLKPTEGAIRVDILSRYRMSVKNEADYIAMNRELDSIFKDSTTRRIERKVSNRSAPFRVLFRHIEKSGNIGDIKTNGSRFLTECSWTIKEVYESTGKAIRSGVIKSIVFLIITKTILGVAAEVPFDLVAEGAIRWTPLIINLAFPPVYMLMLSLTLGTPSEYNTKLLEKQIKAVLYEAEKDDKLVLNKSKSVDNLLGGAGHSGVFNFMYGVFFLSIIAVVSWFLLAFLHFNVASFIIFFVFVSTASFLCFRLSRLVREIEARNDGNQSFGQSLRDFLYMPFVTIGQWVSEKYAKINLVSNMLDLFVELPMKDVLRAIRRWNIFISSKKDEL